LNGGQLLFNGREISDIPRDEMRGKLSLVSQEPTPYQGNAFLFQVPPLKTDILPGTIRENILVGTENELSDVDLDVIAKQAQIFDLAQSLPAGYNTQVGSRGTALSGGQKHRFAIARAIAMGKEILLLDEATSALDSESEALVHEALKQAGKNKSIIAVAHVSSSE
jgi:ATP-binding cassette subfamily B (MDR/TAP) protein 1